MSSPNLSRHSPPQLSASLGPDSDWQVQVHELSATPEDFGHMSDSWMQSANYVYPPTTPDPSNDFLTDTPSLYSFDDYHPLDDNTGNALGLDLPPPAHDLPPSPHGFDNINYYSQAQMSQFGSPIPRQHLPQIVTDGLRPLEVPPHERSPYHLSAGSGQPPLSATTSTPSSAGYTTMPKTPASLPPVNHLSLSPHNNILYTPQTPYTPFHPPYSHQPSPKSPALLLHQPSSSISSPRVGYATEEHYFPPIPQRVSATPKTVLEYAAAFPNYDSIIQQRTYKPNTQSDRRRYVEEVDLEPPIMFFTQHPDGCGIPCRDALTSKFSSLCGRDDAMFKERGPSVSIRINWPGYTPWSRQIPTRDFRSPPQPITRSKLAKNVAKTIQRFIDDMKDKPMEDDADSRLRVGPGRICVHDLELIGLQHVSMGSWQAHIRLRRRT